MADSLAEAIAAKQAELDAAEEDLGTPASTTEGQLAAKLGHVQKLQRELAELESKDA